MWRQGEEEDACCGRCVASDLPNSLQLLMSAWVGVVTTKAPNCEVTLRYPLEMGLQGEMLDTLMDNGTSRVVQPVDLDPRPLKPPANSRTRG